MEEKGVQPSFSINYRMDDQERYRFAEEHRPLEYATSQVKAYDHHTCNSYEVSILNL